MVESSNQGETKDLLTPTASETSSHADRVTGVDYKPNMGTQIAKEVIEEHQGYYDDDGFYIMPDGSFYDPNGYYFDADGYDEFGGYYDGLYYVPGPAYADEYYRRYKEEYGEEEQEYNMEDYFSESDEGGEEVKHEVQREAYNPENDDYELEKEANRLISIAYHINPAIKWLKEQPEVAGKKYTVKIVNAPLKCKDKHIEKLVRGQLKKAGLPDDFTEGTKIVFEKDRQCYNNGIVWFQSTHKNAIIELIKLHNKVSARFRQMLQAWIHHQLKTYLMGFTYDDVPEDPHVGSREDDQSDLRFERHWDNPETQQQVYRKRNKKRGGAAAAERKLPEAMENLKVSEAPVYRKKVVPEQKGDDDYGQETISKGEKVKK